MHLLLQLTILVIIFASFTPIATEEAKWQINNASIHTTPNSVLNDTVEAANHTIISVISHPHCHLTHQYIWQSLGVVQVAPNMN